MDQWMKAGWIPVVCSRVASPIRGAGTCMMLGSTTISIGTVIGTLGVCGSKAAINTKYHQID